MSLNKSPPKYMACDFLMVLAQRPPVWALEPVASKDSSDNPAYSTNSPHPLEGQHASRQPPGNSRALGITQAQGSGVREGGLQPPTPFASTAESLHSLLTY